MEFVPGELRIEVCRASDVIDLRHEVLRAGLPRETAVFAGDDDASTRHFLARWNGRNVGCATLQFNAWQDQPAWQLRGMAVVQSLRRHGIGTRLLRAVDESVRGDSSTCLLWCNARTSAIPFYASQGWQTTCAPFDIPDAGPHVKMIRRYPTSEI